MKTISDMLRDADPVRHEHGVRPEDRARSRRTVLGAAADRALLSARRPFIRRAYVVAVVALVLAVIAVRSQMWPGGNATVQAAVRFEVRLADTQPASGLREMQIKGSERRVYVDQEDVVTNEDILDSRVVQRPDGSGFEIAVTFNAKGAVKMQQATAAHIGRPLAILIDDEVVAAPIVRAPISDKALISGNYTKEEAERIAKGMAIR